MSDPQHKQGDTFDRSGVVTITELGVPVPDLTGWTGTSQVRTKTGTLVQNLTFSWIDASQRLCRLQAANTSGWPLGYLLIDIQFVSPLGAIISTSTASLQCVRDITL